MPFIRKILPVEQGYQFDMKTNRPGIGTFASRYSQQYSLQFDGVNEFMYASHTTKPAITTSVTVAFWIKVTGADSLAMVIGQDSLGGSDRMWNIYYRDLGAGNRRLYFNYWDASGGTGVAQTLTGSDAMVSDGNWHHVVCVTEGTTATNAQRMYVDGVLDVQRTPTGAGIYYSGSSGSFSGVAMSAYSSGSWNYSGYVDEPAIWVNTVLSDADILAIGNNFPDNLAQYSPDLWWRLGDATADDWDGTNWTFKDVGFGGYGHDFVTGNMEQGDVNTEIHDRYAMLFDGVNEALSSGVNPSFAPTGAFSGSVWIKVVDTASSLQAVVAHDSASGASRDWICYYRGTAGDRKVTVVIWNTDGTQNTLASSTAGYFEDGAWHHVAWTYDGTAGTNGFKLYIDGALDVQMTAGSTGIRNYTGTWSDIVVADNSQIAGGWTFGGNIDEVAMWDGTELTSTNVTDIYNLGVADANEVSSLNPDVWLRMGDDPGDIWDGSNYTIKDAGTSGLDMTSNNMESNDKVSDTP